jgi:hypothetical protein
MASYVDPGPPYNGLFTRRFDVAGDGSGLWNVNGDYSVVPATYGINAQPGEELILRRLFIVIMDDGLFRADSFGAVDELTNGMVLRKINQKGAVVYDFLDRAPAVDNASWAGIAQVYRLESFSGGVTSVLSLQFDIGSVDALILYEGERFEVLAQDDLTGLTRHIYAMAGQRNAVIV